VRGRALDRRGADDSTRIARGDHSGRNVTGYNAPRADDRPVPNPGSLQDDRPSADEDIVSDRDSVVWSWLGHRLVPSRHRIHGVEVGVGDYDISAEKNAIADSDRGRRADRSSTHTDVGADPNLGARSKRPKHDRARDAEGCARRFRDEQAFCSDRDRGILLEAGDRRSQQAHLFSDLDSERSQPSRWVHRLSPVFAKAKRILESFPESA
jgi:hypothetical protein